MQNDYDSSVKFERDLPAGRNAFTGYGEGYVEVNRARYVASLVVSGERLVDDWPVRSVADITPESLEAILAMKPEVVLLGTGATFAFPEPRALAPLAKSGVGLESMDTAAACRTYNILLAEGRNVVAALIL